VKAILDIGVLLVTVLMMVTVGMELETGDFRRVAQQKGTLLCALLLPAGLLPALGFGLTRLMGLPAHLSAGVLLLAACPVGDIANFYTLLAGGNLALSVSVNTLSCLLSVATMAVAFELYDHLLGQPYVFALPTAALVTRLTLMVALPVLAGLAVRRWRPALAASHRKTLRNLCLAGIALLLVYVLVNRWAQVAAEWRQTALAGVAFVAAAFLTGLALALGLRLSARDGVTVAILLAVRNVALASAIAVTLLNRLEFAVFAVIYFLTEVPLLLGAVGVYRRWWVKAPRLAAQANTMTEIE
jgi:bile acid:Na+ symporter, BASS family